MDGQKVCLNTAEDAFGVGIDYAVLQKICGAKQMEEK
jgi:hypothetical protein